MLPELRPLSSDKWPFSHAEYQPNGALPISSSAVPISNGEKVCASTSGFGVLGQSPVCMPDAPELHACIVCYMPPPIVSLCTHALTTFLCPACSRPGTTCKSYCPAGHNPYIRTPPCRCTRPVGRRPITACPGRWMHLRFRASCSSLRMPRAAPSRQVRHFYALTVRLGAQQHVI